MHSQTFPLEDLGARQPTPNDPVLANGASMSLSLSRLRMLTTYLLSLPASMECSTDHLPKLAPLAVFQLQILWGELHYVLSSSWRLNWTNAILLHLSSDEALRPKEVLIVEFQSLSLTRLDAWTLKKKSPIISLRH